MGITRWQTYLTMDDYIARRIMKVRWTYISSGLIIVISLAATIALVIARLLRRDCTHYSYNKVTTDDEENNGGEEFGWKLVHADIFRPPNHSMILAVFCGTGAQLLGTSVLTLVLVAMKYVSSTWRGSFIMAMLISYPLMGGIAGYVTARLYKSINGESWQKAACMTAFGFPSIALMIFFLLNMCATFERSLELSQLLARMAILILLWLGSPVHWSYAVPIWGSNLMQLYSL